MHVFVSRALQKILRECPKKHAALRQSCIDVIGALPCLPEELRHASLPHFFPAPSPRRGPQEEWRRVVPAARGRRGGVAAVDAAAGRRAVGARGARHAGGEGRRRGRGGPRRRRRRRRDADGRRRAGLADVGVLDERPRLARRGRRRRHDRALLRAAAPRVRVEAAADHGGGPPLHAETDRLRLRPRQGGPGGCGAPRADGRRDGDGASRLPTFRPPAVAAALRAPATPPFPPPPPPPRAARLPAPGRPPPPAAHRPPPAPLRTSRSARARTRRTTRSSCRSSRRYSPP